jgi:hypothetical protein
MISRARPGADAFLRAASGSALSGRTSFPHAVVMNEALHVDSALDVSEIWDDYRPTRLVELRACSHFERGARVCETRGSGRSAFQVARRHGRGAACARESGRGDDRSAGVLGNVCRESLQG